MTLWQRTILRIGIGSAVLAALIYRFLRLGYSPRTELLFAGGTLAIGGILSLVIRPSIYRAAPNIDEELKPTFGYGLPMRLRVPFLVLMAVVGLGLFAWALFGFQTSN
jgi:hypothetical protein